jgi:hypothetical protein
MQAYNLIYSYNLIYYSHLIRARQYTQLYNQNPGTDTLITPASSSTAGLFRPIFGSCSQNAVMGNNALGLGATPSISAPSAFPSSAAGPSTSSGISNVALSIPSRKRKFTDGKPNEKKYKCNFCGYATNLSRDLRKHIMVHTGEKPYKCNFCDYESNQDCNLKTHIKRRHRDEKNK